MILVCHNIIIIMKIFNTDIRFEYRQSFTSVKEMWCLY